MWIGKIAGAFAGIIGLLLAVFDYISCKPWEYPSGCPWEIKNYSPNARVDQVKTIENQSINIDVLANDSDENTELLKIYSFSSPSHGQITLSKNNMFRYQPKAGFVGEDFFTYTIIDNLGKTAQARVEVMISALPSNHPPIAHADQAITTFEQSIEIDVLANDIDPDHDVLKIHSISQPLIGEVTLAGNKLNYHPKPTFVGKDQFTYQISDGSAQIAEAQVNITILSVKGNHPPIAQPDQSTTRQGATILIDVLANDSDPDNDPIKIISFSGASNGEVTLENQALRYTPSAQFVGDDYFSYVIEDIHNHSAEAKVIVTVSFVLPFDLVRGDQHWIIVPSLI